jgi:hypothetical protein
MSDKRVSDEQPGMRVFRSLLWAPAFVCLLSPAALAQEVNDALSAPAAFDKSACANGDTRCSYGRTWFSTLYFDRMTFGDLSDVPKDVFDGRLWDHHQYFIGGALSYVAVHDLHIAIPFTNLTAIHNRIEIEGQLDQHFGTRHNTEAVMAMVFRTGDIPLFAGTTLNLAIGDGLSYFFSAPTTATGISQPKLLNYLSGEVEFGSDQLAGLHIVPQLHHRSGAYGIFASKGAGSTYIGIGLRADLK